MDDIQKNFKPKSSSATQIITRIVGDMDDLIKRRERKGENMNISALDLTTKMVSLQKVYSLVKIPALRKIVEKYRLTTLSDC